MPYIGEHDTKQERESDYPEQRRVDLLIVRNTISVSDLLEWSCELIYFEICRRCDIMVVPLPDLWTINVAIFLDQAHFLIDLLDFGVWCPKESHKQHIPKLQLV